jgi:hypothetical protein
MGEIWAENGSPELGDLVGGRSVGDERRPATEEGWRWRTMVAGSCENGRRNWKNDGERTLAKDGERRWPKMENDSGKKMGRWREGGKIWGEAWWEQK